MNGCRPFRELLSEALDGPLSREDQARLDAHLEGCAECRAYAKDLAAVRDAVRGVEAVEPPVGFATRVMAHVRAEAAPKPTVWQRLRPYLLKPQFQVATLLLVGVTSALIIRSRSGLGDADVLKQMKGRAPATEKAAPAPESAPAMPRPAETPSMEPPRQEALRQEAPRQEAPRREADGQVPAGGAGTPAEADKLKRSRDADRFAPPPPAAAPDGARTAPAPAPAAPPLPAAAPAPAPAPQPEASAESKAFGYTAPPKAAKPAAGAGPGAANTAASAPARAEAARDGRRPSLDDGGAREKKGEASLAKEQAARQAAGKDEETQAEDGVPAVFLVWEPEDPATASTVAAREVEALGGTVFRGGRRQQQVPRSLTGRLPAHQLPQLQARLSRHGAVRPGAGQQQQAPRSGSVVFLLRW